MTAKSFVFNVIVVFLSTVLGGAVFSGAQAFIQNPAHIPSLLASKVPPTSNFFFTCAHRRAR